MKKLNYFIKQEFKETKGKIVDIFACELRELGLDSDLPQKGTKPTQSRKMNTTNKNYSSQAPKENKSASRDNLNKFATKALEKQRLNDRFEQIENQLKENNKGKACEIPGFKLDCHLSLKQTKPKPPDKMKDTQKNQNSQAPSLKGSKKYIAFWQFVFDKSHDDGSYKINHITEAKKYGVTRMTIHRWLKKGLKEGLITNYKPGQNIVSKRKIGWQNLLKTRFTVVHKANQYKQSKDVTLSPKGDNFSKYTKDDDQKILFDKDYLEPYQGPTKQNIVEIYEKKVMAIQKTALTCHQAQLNYYEAESVTPKTDSYIDSIFSKFNLSRPKMNKITATKNKIQEIMDICEVFLHKLRNCANFHNIIRHFWLLCGKLRVNFADFRKFFEPKSRFKVNFRPLTYQQELELIKHFVPFSKISKELVDLYGSKFYNMCLQGFRKDYSKVTHEKSEYWRNHSKFKLSKGKYYTLEILNFELKAYVKRQVIISRQKQKLGQKYVEPKLYCHNI